MIAIILVAGNMCLFGGEQIDVSGYVPRTAGTLELKVTLSSATGTLLVYSPGYENQLAQFDKQHLFRGDSNRRASAVALMRRSNKSVLLMEAKQS